MVLVHFDEEDANGQVSYKIERKKKDGTWKTTKNGKDTYSNIATLINKQIDKVMEEHGIH